MSVNSLNYAEVTFCHALEILRLCAQAASPHQSSHLSLPGAKIKARDTTLTHWLVINGPQIDYFRGYSPLLG